MTENRKRVCVCVRRSPESASVCVGVRPVRVVYTGDADNYKGSYTVEPMFAEQTLATKDKHMTKNVTVNPIYVSDTSNAAGGYTIFIGGEFIGG